MLNQRQKRVFAAVKMEAYMQVGLSREHAAKRVACVFGCKPSIISNWRARLTGPKPPDDWEAFDWERFNKTGRAVIQSKRAAGAWRTAQDVDAFAKRLASNFGQKPSS